MKDGQYVPRSDRSDYPGIEMSSERAEQLRRLNVDIDDITVDDIVYNVSKNGSSFFFGLLRLIEENHGAEAMREIARQFGYIAGRSNYRKMQKRFGVETLGPERLALYEDTVHLLSGVDMATAISSYDETTCTITRTRCSFFTGHPPGAQNYCKYVSEGFTRAYHEADPNLVEIEYNASLRDGDDHCEHVFRYRKPEAEGNEGP
jgi:hypothetical protein